jgi:hypothetical protein
VIFFLKDRHTRKLLLEGKCRNGLYPLPSAAWSPQLHPPNKSVLFATRPTMARWHHRLGHASSSIVHRVVSHNKLSFFEDNLDQSVCDACQQAKSHQLPFLKSLSVSKVPLELVFFDVWGVAPLSVRKFKYYVSFICDYSKFTWLYLLKHKSDIFHKFHEFQKMVECLFYTKIHTIQTDWGGEYQKLTPFFQHVGILHHVPCPHIHQQNGFTEHKHRHIVEVGLSLLAHAAMPLKFWGEAFSTVVYLINRTLSRVIEFSSPYAKLFGSSPDYTWLKVFGCTCWPHLRPYNSRKLAFWSKQCVFLGYSPSHKGYKCLDVSTGRVYISCDVMFDEGVFPFPISIQMPGLIFMPKYLSFLHCCTP